MSIITIPDTIPEKYRETDEAAAKEWFLAMQACNTADLRAEAAQRIEQLKSAGAPDLPEYTDLIEVSPRILTAEEWSKDQAEAGGITREARAMANQIVKNQIESLRNFELTRESFEYELGNPKTLVCLNKSAFLLTIVSLNSTLGAGPTTMSGPNEIIEPLKNRFTLALSQNSPARPLELMMSNVMGRFRFLFTLNQTAVITPTIFTALNGMYSLSTGPETYFFPFTFTSPLARITMKQVVTIEVNGRALPNLIPTRTLLSEIAGPNRRISRALGVSLPPDGTTTVTGPGFAVQGLSDVSIIVEYQIQILVSEGGRASLDALTGNQAGIFTPAVWLSLET